MRIFHVFIVVVSCIDIWTFAFIPPSITTDHIEQNNNLISRFVELKQGEKLTLRCSHSQFEEVDFDFPAKPDNVIISNEDDALILAIDKIKVDSTGSYKCHVKDDESLYDELYVFVQDELKIFIPFMALALQVPENNFTVPCRTNRFVSKANVALEVNGKKWKSAQKAFDPRIGFQLTNKNIEEKLSREMTFKCFHDVNPQDLAEFIIAPKHDETENNLVLEWNITQWPYVGAVNHTLACILRNQNNASMIDRHKYTFKIECPRCDDTAHVKMYKKQIKSYGTSLVASIDSLTEEDSGLYKCTYIYDIINLKETIEYDMEVSPKKGQLKLLERSPEKKSVREGEDINLFANLSAFPTDLPGFTASWKRVYSKALKSVNETEVVLTDDNRKSESDLPGDGTVNEALFIKSASTNLSGIYTLSLQLLDTVKTVDFDVEILSRRAKSKIDIMSQESFVLFDQKYYKTGTQIRIICLVTSLPLMNVQLHYRKYRSRNEWTEVEEALEIKGTFESGLQWNTTTEYDMELKCTGRNEELVAEEDRKIVRTSEQEFNVATKWDKSEKGKSLDESSEIYEGDTVHLTCSYPRNTLWKGKWIRGKEILLEEVEDPSMSSSEPLVLTLKDIKAEETGKYDCVLSNGITERNLSQTITIVKTTKPYHSKPSSEEPINYQYGSPATFDCNMEGIPTPRFLWLKDGRIYAGGILSNGNRTLTIPRVVGEDQGEFVCESVNRAGSAVYSIKTTVTGSPKKMSGTMMFFICLIIISLLCCIVAITCMYIKQRKRGKQLNSDLQILYDQLMNSTAPPQALSSQQQKKIPIDEQLNSLTFNKKYEIDRNMIEEGETIGHGNFGMVKLGYLKYSRVSDSAAAREKLPVAIKVPLNGRSVTQQKMLADELKIMCAIGNHPNVLSLIGACTKAMTNGELLVVIEYCEKGNLKDFLLKHRQLFIDELRPPKSNEADANSSYLVPNSAKKKQYAATENPDFSTEMETERLLPDKNAELLATSDLLSFAMQIADGMDYLGSIPCIHRDLAARNILVSHNNIIRIADFGMARQDKNYYTIKQNKNVALPVRWMSIEAIETWKFTKESDVWSYGVVLYEIFTLGGNPYPTVPNDKILDHLKEDKRMPCPERCHDEIHEVMLQCWDKEPHNRPAFNQCRKIMQDHLKMASPELLHRVEKELVRESEKRLVLAQMLGQSEVQQPSNLANHSVNDNTTERVYLSDLPRP